MQDIVHVPFHGETITTIETEDGVYVPVRPLCERFGLSLTGQAAKFRNAPERFSVKMIFTEGSGGERESICLPLHKVAGWLATINPAKVNPDIREALTAYQREADDVLDRHFRLRAREKAEALDRARDEAGRFRQLALAADPVFNKIARLQEAGVYRRVVWAALRKSSTETYELVRSMEKLGLIDPRMWLCEIEDREEQRREAEQEAALAQSPLEEAAAELARQFPEA